MTDILAHSRVMPLDGKILDFIASYQAAHRGVSPPVGRICRPAGAVRGRKLPAAVEGAGDQGRNRQRRGPPRRAAGIDSSSSADIVPFLGGGCIRAAELAQLDPSNRALQERIYALKDEQAETQRLNAIAGERAGLEKQLLQLSGDTALIRAAELAQLDPTNRALQQLIWARQDEIAATEAAAQAAAAIAQQRDQLERQLLDLNGDTLALRARDLALVPEELKALQQAVWARQDEIAIQQAAQQAAEEAARAAQQLRDAWTDTADGIMEEVERIRGLTGAGGSASFAALQAQFDAATAAARGGNQEAADSLPALSKALLDAAAAVAGSRAELDQISGVTAASLEETYRRIMGVVAGGGVLMNSGLNNGASSGSWWQTSAAAAATTPGTAQNDEVASELKAIKAEIAGMRSDNNGGNAQIAGNTGGLLKIFKILTRNNQQVLTVKVEEAA